MDDNVLQNKLMLKVDEKINLKKIRYWRNNKISKQDPWKAA